MSRCLFLENKDSFLEKKDSFLEKRDSFLEKKILSWRAKTLFGE